MQGVGRCCRCGRETWSSAQGQIKQVVNNVVFPIVDMILLILFFVKLGTAYFDYRKHGQFEFVAPYPVRLPCLYANPTSLYLGYPRNDKKSVEKHRICRAIGGFGKENKSKMFGWLQDLIDGISNAISQKAFSGIGQQITSTIWTTMMTYGCMMPFTDCRRLFLNDGEYGCRNLRS